MSVQQKIAQYKKDQEAIAATASFDWNAKPTVTQAEFDLETAEIDAAMWKFMYMAAAKAGKAMDNDQATRACECANIRNSIYTQEEIEEAVNYIIG